MKKSRTRSAIGSKGLKSGKTRERGYFASSQVNKIFILLTSVSKFIAALPGGFSGFQGSPPAADDLCLPSLQHGWIVFLILPRSQRSCQRKTTGALWRQNCSSGPACVCWRRLLRWSDTLPLDPTAPCFRAAPTLNSGEQLPTAACPVYFRVLPFPSRENLL